MRLLDWLVQALEGGTHGVHHGQLGRVGLAGEVDLHAPDGVLQRGCSHRAPVLPTGKQTHFL